MKRPVVLLTGGGTAGHVSVNEALIPVFLERGYDVHYIGSHDGIEKEIIKKGQPQVTYHSIQSGKLRRYFSLKNFTDPFRVGVGVLQALSVIMSTKPEVIFSKGGFVSVPVVLAGKIANVPVVIHESDVTPGLANKLALPMSTHIFTVFEETLTYVPNHKATWTGSVIRPELFEGRREKGLALTGFSGDKKILIVMGGSQGSVVLNNAVRNNLGTLTKTFDVIHLCGKGNIDNHLKGVKGYKQYDYVTTELPDLLAVSDLAVSRAGSNAIFELLALRIPMLLVPLSAAKSRGDQLLNASLFEKLGFADILQEEEVDDHRFIEMIQKLDENKDTTKSNMMKTGQPKTPDEMVDLILKSRS